MVSCCCFIIALAERARCDGFSIGMASWCGGVFRGGLVGDW